MNPRMRPYARLVAMALLFLAAGAASAQTSLEDLFKNPQFTSAALSPNGKYLATTANIGGRMQLAVVDIETGAAKNVAGYETLDVNNIQWINDDRIVFSIIDRDGEQTSSTSGLYAINRDGSKSAILMQSPQHIRGWMDSAKWTSEPRGMAMLGRAFDDDSNAIMAVGYFPNRDALPYRVDSLTGKRKEIEFDVSGQARSFVVDRTNRLRVVVTTNATHSQLFVWYRDQSDKGWRKLSEHSSLEPTFEVVGFDADGATMIVSAPTADGLKGIYKYDFANNKPGELLASDKAVDVDGVMSEIDDARFEEAARVMRMPTRA